MESRTKDISIAVLKKLITLGRHVGHTPLQSFTRIFQKQNVLVYGKQEWAQLSGSVKCRAAYFIFRDALKNGLLHGGKTLLDATSGNTGIAYAAIGRELGIKVALCLPENASKERKEILQKLGAEIILTSRFEGTDGAQQVAREMVQTHPDTYFYADQYRNDNNWKAHYQTTAIEIFTYLPGITHFVTGLGTTGTFVGTGRRLKELKPSVRLISLQPDSALHALEGWKHLETAVVPKIYDPTIAHEQMEISTEEAYETLKEVYRKENLLLSPSSAANVAGALKVAQQLESGIVVTVLPDNADKYGEVISRLLPGIKTFKT